MGRNRIKGLEFFPFDVDYFSDIKVRKLIKYQGGKAVTVYLCLLCMIYKEGYYMKWDKELPFIISENTGFDEAYIQEVIECCMRLGLVSERLFKSSQVVTSRGIQERYQRICARERRLSTIDEFSLIDVEDEQDLPPAPPKEYFTDLCKASFWRTNLAQRNKISEQETLNYITQFAEYCRSRGKVHQDLYDAQQHFANWLCKKLENKEKRTKKTNDTAKTKSTDRRRASAVQDHKPEDYTGAF